MDEFDLIRSLFAPIARSEGAAGLADDVAELELKPPGRLVVTMDTIVEGVHFLPTDPLETLAAKLVRVNVSDLLAKGARPDAALLALTWPAGRDPAALPAFARRLGEELSDWGAHLVGGDTTTTPGPLVLSLTLTGWCGAAGPVRRSGARVGDDVWLTGSLGDGWLGLRAARNELPEMSPDDTAWLTAAYQTPAVQPLALARLMGEHATAAIDVSDGLAQDAGHLALASGLRLEIDWRRLPLSPPAQRWLSVAPGRSLAPLVGGGDDYQALFCAPGDEATRAALSEAAERAGIRLTRIGAAVAGAGVDFVDAAGERLAPGLAGWRHNLG